MAFRPPARVERGDRDGKAAEQGPEDTLGNDRLQARRGSHRRYRQPRGQADRPVGRDVAGVHNAEERIGQDADDLDGDERGRELLAGATSATGGRGRRGWERESTPPPIP